MTKYFFTNMIVALFLSSLALASGGGGGGGSFGGGGGFSGGGGSKPRTINSEKFDLGRSVFSGRAELAPKVVSRDLYLRQARTLVRLQKKIARSASDSAARKFMPQELAGRMSTKQLSALSYYVKHSFK